MEVCSNPRSTFVGDAKTMAGIIMPLFEGPLFFPCRPPTGQHHTAILSASDMFKKLTIAQPKSQPH